MSRISFSRCLQETGAFFVTTALSCGPSQLCCSIKLLVDTSLLLVNCNRGNKITSNIKKNQNDWNNFKTSTTVSLIAKKLGIESSHLTQKQVENYLRAKNRKVNGKVSRLFRSIRADTYALIPLIGAHLSWRTTTNYKGRSFIPFYSHAIEQLLGHFKHLASYPLFMGRKSKATNEVSGYGWHVEVSTSTKNRKIYIEHNVASELNKSGFFEAGKWTAGKEKAPTVVLFHPNMGGATSMSRDAEIYRQKGYNTLAVTFGGYEGSPGVNISEKSMYQDIEAIKIYLSNLGVTEVAYHGFSLGTGAAFQAAVGKSSVKNLKTLFVTVDQPYSSAATVGENVASFLGRGALSAACPVDLDVELPGGLWTKTDGLNNLKKAALLKEKQIRLICFELDQDSFMGWNKVDGKFTKNFAQDLLFARYGETEDAMRNCITLSGDHGCNSLVYSSYYWNHDLIPSLNANS